ncbi:MAG TPA: helix-turn-helix transcriptional regulator [Pedobacter sp.]|nr:helix-turn-helix transcriptional regulator [Pedobacter sp.]
MELHHGQTIERIIRRNGYSITELARLTSVNRRSVYNWFNQRHLKPEIIYRIGAVINYDFSTIFPGIFMNEDFNPSEHNKLTEPESPVSRSQEDTIWKDKYIELLERYNELLSTYISKVNLDQD